VWDVNDYRRRGSERYQVDVSVRIYTADDVLPAVLVDISMEGAKLECGTPYQPGQRIAIELDG
jgi:hypothetical protein